MENTTQEKNKKGTDKYTCPNCGGKVEFNPKLGKPTCVYCSSVIDVDESQDVNEKDLHILLKDAVPWNEAEVIQCENCGAKEVISKGEIATNCAFCGTANIVKTQEIVGMTPHGLCPFEKTKEEACELAEKWARKKFFAPNSFKKSAKAQDVKGMYSPAFSFDCSTYTKYDGRLGIRRSETRRGFDGKTTTHTYTDYFNVSGDFNREFDDLLIHTSSTIPNDMISQIEPYPTEKAINYDQKYLAGFSASTYGKDGNTSWKESKEKMKGIIRREILNKYHHDTVSYLNTDVEYSNGKFKYLLLPLYVGHHKYKGKNYNFYVNGSTGKVAGKSPVSGWKVFFTVLLGLAVISIPIILRILGIIN